MKLPGAGSRRGLSISPTAGFLTRFINPIIEKLITSLESEIQPIPAFTTENINRNTNET
jgi:hypothetical protein